MNNNDFEFDIDSILAEFTTDAPASVPQNNSAPLRSAQTQKSRFERENAIQEENYTRPKNASRNESRDVDATVIFSSVNEDEDPRYKPVKPKATKQEIERKEKPVKKPSADRKPEKTKEKKEAKPTPMLSILFAVCFTICLVWGLFNIKPFTASTTTNRPIATPAPAKPTEQVMNTDNTDVDTSTTENQGTEAEVQETPEPVVEKTKYVLAEGQMAPKPNQACYGQVSVTNASQIDNIIDQAREIGLLGEDETVAFNSNAEFNQGSYYEDIMYYLDETILVIAWKELDEGSTLTMCEIKIADGSQFRMEVFGDIFNENDNSYLSQMIMANNAVVGMNSDKCKARGDGVLVCDRTLYKYNENIYAGSLKRYNCLDNCYVTGDGDMLFTKRLQEKTTEEMQQFIADNNIVFSISFGPLLIENGEMVYGYNPGDDNYIEYAFGETEKPYSRCGMGQIDSRHYLYVSLNHSDEQQARWTMREFAQHIYNRGVVNSFYGLDGGQTAELIINNKIYNHIDFGAERYTSNCIYFATAIPNGEG